MRYLLDTHVLLWWLNDDKRLKEIIKDVLIDPKNVIFSSVVNAWEVSIKKKTKKGFRLKTSIKRAFEVAGFDMINVELKHILKLEKLPLYHKDPFDRILIAQAKTEKLTLVTADKKIWKYKVKLLKC